MKGLGPIAASVARRRSAIGNGVVPSPPVLSMWDPAKLGTGMVIFDGGRSVGAVSDLLTDECAVASGGRNSGVLQFEMTLTGDPAPSYFGICNASQSLSVVPGSDANAFTYAAGNGAKFSQGSGIGYGSALVSGDVLGVVIDFNAVELRFYRNGSTPGIAYDSGTNQPLLPAVYYPCFGLDYAFTPYPSAFLNTGQEAFKYPVAGATPWL